MSPPDGTDVMNRSVRLAYGEEGLWCDFPEDRTTVIEPEYVPAPRDSSRVLRDALASPIGKPRLRDMVGSGASVAISICDLTRPQPRQLMVEALLEELRGIVTPQDVTILVATGTHRGNRPDELRRMLGERLLRTCRVINHNARDPESLLDMGVHGDGVHVLLNRAWVEADVRITTGFVEPHFFAGFSGGPKMVAPGLAGLDTVLTLHDAKRIGHPLATWGICEGNPVHDDVRAISNGTGVDFALDVILNRDKRVTHAFAGDLLLMHRKARDVCKAVAMRPVDGQYEVVVTTNSGFPLDQNLYQAVKGMSAAMNVVVPGGTIICAAECADGLPDHGSYRDFLASAESIAELKQIIESSPTTTPDQWQVQIQARVQERARVMVKADGLTDDQIVAAHLEPCEDIAATVQRELARFGEKARVCVLPEGPQTIPYLAG